ncbi:hypothetical protein BT63DRAFT_427176 [Microthyrium microscopicum]|uniref:FAD-binding FR-type domain-containing protein n=1 Tax=Microthyrium microscopicum TaxID=703497 RepID=A0A6A6U724_9PEZI|nr:hypothetical protein BT63DRAFT_427176 [Microthyrium microscopicum]
MGYLGFEFVSLTPEQVASRRISLDNYARIAQSSQVMVLITLAVGQVLWRTIESWNYGDSKQQSSSSLGLRQFKTWRWRLGDEVLPGFGTWKQWIGGLSWTIWLAILCIRDTSPDYMHLTKRFGIVAASQLPLHFLLAMKSPYSPIQIILQTSHESLNAVHHVLGRIIMFFLVLHASFYLNFFAQIGVLSKRIRDKDVMLGVSSILLLLTIGSTATSQIRGWNYRLFYSIHVIVPPILLSLLYFHVTHIRLYVLQSAFLFLLNIATRLWHSKRVSMEVSIPNDANLVKMSTSSATVLNGWEAGQHVYIRKDTGLGSYLRSYPLTIATFWKSQDPVFNLIARAKTKAGYLSTSSQVLLGSHPQENSASHMPVDESKPINLFLEGPYGDSKFLPKVTNFESIILVAGGIGATYILPVWREILVRRKGPESKGGTVPQVKLVWTLRNIHETDWATNTLRDGSSQHFSTDQCLLHLSTATAQSVDLDQSLKDKAKDLGFSLQPGRPNFKDIVDYTFMKTEGRVGLFVCGPKGMAHSLREQVGKHVMRGRDVFWHAEEFGL